MRTALRPLNRRLFVALALAVVAAALFDGSARARAAGWTAVFTDPAGDVDAGAPDVTKVTIAGDAATGALVITVTAASFLRATPDGLERRVLVWLDTDKDADTGSRSGAEYRLSFVVDPAGPTRSWDIQRWDGAGWATTGHGRIEVATRTNELRWTLNAADLAGATAFGLHSTTVTRDAAHDAILQDVAPDDDQWAFEFTGPAFTTRHFVRPRIGTPLTIPGDAVAAKRFTVYFPVTLTGLPFAPAPPGEGTNVSRVTIGGKAIPHTQLLTRGRAVVSLVVPKTARGQRIKLQVTVTAPSFRGEDGHSSGFLTGYIGVVATYYSGKSATTSATFQVR